ncbi:MAG: HEAT repeat domain-containing protein [Candidatus Binataceae bacterium]|jgi:HEAT repeat protein
MAKSKLTILATAVSVVMLTAVSFVSAKNTVEAKGAAGIEQLVGAGKVPEAAQKLKAEYKFDNSEGLHALREFSMAVLRRGLNETDQFERCYVASALGANGDNEGVPILEAAFSSPDPGIKMAAVDGLGDMNNGLAAASLQRLYHSADEYGRRMLLQGVAQVDNPEAIGVLTEAAGEKDSSTRLLAVEALGRLHDTSVLPQLRKLLLTEETPYNQITVAHAMLLLGDNSGVDTLLRVLNGSNNSDYRAAAILALADARDVKVADDLKKALADPDLEVRMAAAGALTHYNDGEGLPVLRTAMEAPDSRTRADAAQLLDHLDFAVGKDTILAALSSRDPDLWMAGARALGLHGGDQAVGPLVNALASTPDPMMRASVAWSLGRIGTQRCIEPLLGLVAEPDPAVRYTAADALVRVANRLEKQPAESASKSNP